MGHLTENFILVQYFWLISQEPNSSQTQNLCSNIANNRHFHYRPNSEKINEEILFFSKNPALLPTSSYIFPTSFPNLGKTNDPIQRKHGQKDGRMEGRKNGWMETTS